MPRDLLSEPPARRGRDLLAPPDERDSWIGKADAFVRGLADTLTFGTADEISALLGSVTGIGGERGDYEASLEAQRGVDRSDAENRGGYRIAGQVAGAVTGGAGLARQGLSMGANAAARGGSLGRVALGSAADGAIYGGAQGYGSGEGMEDRAKRAAVGSAVGGITGIAAPYAVAGAAEVVRPIVAPIGARMNPAKYAGRAVTTALRRSGKSADEIAAGLRNAQLDEQGVYAVADEMGHAGQRMLAATARSPHEGRQVVVEVLENRQAGQGRRIASALDDAFSPSGATAAARTASDKAARSAQARVNYGAAREAAGAVDTSTAMQQLDDILTPGVSKIVGTGTNDGSVYGTLSRVRKLLGKGDQSVIDFDRAFMAKTEMDDIIGRGGQAAALLRPARDALDDALAKASGPYATARDTYRAQSKAMEATDIGRKAATRGRSDDTIPVFQRMMPEEQANFRVGYGDRLIEGTEGAATGVNKARPLINDATAREFPAFAVPGTGDQLGRRLTRENVMFETRNAALGGSRTADNIADMADFAQFDPTVLAQVLQGRPLAALQMAGSRIMQEARGMPPSVMELVSKALMETNPQAARTMLTQGMMHRNRSEAERAAIAYVLSNLASSGAARGVSP